jgi:hypothetical protein
VDLTASLDILGKRNIVVQCCDLNSGSSASQPIAIRFIYITTLANNSTNNNDDEEDDSNNNISVFH